MQSLAIHELDIFGHVEEGVDPVSVMNPSFIGEGLTARKLSRVILPVSKPYKGVRVRPAILTHQALSNRNTKNTTLLV